jgi:folate-binding protein YgfZ
MSHTNLRVDIEKEYLKVLSSCGIKTHAADVLRLRGQETLDFLQRMSTNDVLHLKSNEHAVTVLTNEKGRIVDIVVVVVREEGIFLLTSPSRSNHIKIWLEKFIILEDVFIENVTDQYQCLLILGKHVPETLHHLQLFKDIRWTIDAHLAFLSVSEYFVLVPSLEFLSDDVFEILRIEQGIPRYEKELSDNINPLEAGLEKFISFTKGCYIGQEVIARLDTYKKLQKKLHGFVFDTSEPLNEVGKLLYNDEQVGWTTSHCWSVSLGKPVALGYVKTSANSETYDFVSNTSPVKTKVHRFSLPLTPAFISR